MRKKFKSFWNEVNSALAAAALAALLLFAIDFWGFGSHLLPR